MAVKTAVAVTEARGLTVFENNVKLRLFMSCMYYSVLSCIIQKDEG